jgi:predicted esterase
VIKENHIIINKTARYYTMGELTDQTKHVWVVLHGFRQNAKSFLAEFKPLSNASTFFIAPEALNRFYLDIKSTKVGATWMTREDRLNEIKDYIHYLDDLYENFELERFGGVITALGFSQGASTVTRWLDATKFRIDNTIVYAGEVAPELLPLHEHSGLKRTKNYYICGTQDEFFTPALLDSVKEAYKDLNFTSIMFEGKHELNLEVLKGLVY